MNNAEDAFAAGYKGVRGGTTSAPIGATVNAPSTSPMPTPTSPPPPGTTPTQVPKATAPVAQTPPAPTAPAAPTSPTADPASKYNMTNFNAAHEALTMTPQEQGLYMHHLAQAAPTMSAPGGAAGVRPTVEPLNLQVGDRYHNIPTIWGGQALSWDNPQARATLLANIQKAGGFSRFPSYPSADEADARYAAMQRFMARDFSR